MINEINAEMMLNYLYPELAGEWVAHCRGTFYRNYSDDAMSVDPASKSVELSRDGFLKMLPPEYISLEKEQESDERLRERIETLTEAFLPVDSLMFRQQLHVERTVAGMLRIRTAFVLKRIFGIDLDGITNPYVRDAALLLPYVRQSRGDIGWVRRMLESVTLCPVEMTVGRWSDDDSSRTWMPYVHYSVVCDGLTQSDFQREYARLQELSVFVMEHWMPAEVVMKIDLITHIRKRESAILDYSCEMD